MTDAERKRLMEWTVEITKAYFGNPGINQSTNSGHVTELIQEVYDKLLEIHTK